MIIFRSMRRLPYLLMAVLVIGAAWVIEPHVSRNQFATSGLYTDAVLARGTPSTPVPTGALGPGSSGSEEALGVGSTLCPEHVGVGLGPPPREAVEGRFLTK